MAVNATTASHPLATTTTASTTAAATEAGSADRFLKLLVAQMQNQDPLNPLDNAQVTSQMAQINTVTGISKLNETVQSLTGQFVQMQALQGAALVGREVVVPGNRLAIADGQGRASFELTSAATAVKLEVLNAGGNVVDTVELGAAAAGRHDFAWDARKGGTDTDLTFRITATNGGTALSSTALMRDRVNAISTGGDTLTLELARAGSTPYASVKSLN